MTTDNLPFRCGRCDAFVDQQRLHEANDFGPKSCKNCEKEHR